MGYTHHWYRPQVLSHDIFRAAVADFKRLIPKFKSLDIKLVSEARKGRPLLENFRVQFNGEPGCENFLMEAMFTDRMPRGPAECFGFCKTEHRRYDLAVMAGLLVFKHHFPVELHLGSDGEMSDWRPAMELVRDILGYTEEWEFVSTEKDGLTDRRLEICQPQPSSSNSSKPSESPQDPPTTISTA